MGLASRGHTVQVLTLCDGPRREYLQRFGIPISVVEPIPQKIAAKLRDAAPDVIHFHAPGGPHEGDVLGDALALLPKIPVVQTNIFGRLDNPHEDSWTDFRLFISWTSCVQAARRSRRVLDASFFRRASVAVYPVDPDNGPPGNEVAAFREGIGLSNDEILFGRFSRPEPNKWTDLPIRAFRRAFRSNRRIKLLLREPPQEVARELDRAKDRAAFVVLPATADTGELRRTMAATDVILHTSLMGESFGYGIAEPMNLGKPVITNSVPWLDQAQLELVRHGECGLVASTVHSMAKAILLLSYDADARARLGLRGQQHVRSLADAETSITRVEKALTAASRSKDNPLIEQDIADARIAENYLSQEQFGHSLADQISLRTTLTALNVRRWASSIRREWLGRRNHSQE